MKKILFLLTIVVLFSCKKPLNEKTPDISKTGITTFCWQCQERTGDGSDNGVNYSVCKKTEADIKIYISQGTHIIAAGTIKCTKE